MLIYLLCTYQSLQIAVFLQIHSFQWEILKDFCYLHLMAILNLGFLKLTKLKLKLNLCNISQFNIYIKLHTQFRRHATVMEQRLQIIVFRFFKYTLIQNCNKYYASKHKNTLDFIIQIYKTYTTVMTF